MKWQYLQINYILRNLKYYKRISNITFKTSSAACTLTQLSQRGCVCKGFKLTPEPPRKPGSPQSLPCPSCYFPLSCFRLGTVDQQCPGHLTSRTDVKHRRKTLPGLQISALSSFAGLSKGYTACGPES